MNKYVEFLIFFTICLFPFSVKADCNDSEINQLKEKAKGVSISYYTDASKTYYDYDKGEEVRVSGVVNVVINGLTNDFSVIDVDSGFEFSAAQFTDGKLVIDSISDSWKGYYIYSNRCNVKIRDISITIPEYNEYSSDPLCEGLEDKLDICSESASPNVDYDSFKKTVEEYKKNEEQSSNENNDNATNVINDVKTFVFSNWMFVVPVAVFIIIVIIFIAKRIRKRSVLE